MTLKSTNNRSLLRTVLLWLVCHTTAVQASWWLDPQRTVWKPVDQDYNWNYRQTGIQRDWTVGLALWSHYNASALSSTSIQPIPWTSGRMLKFLRQGVGEDDSSFELRSVYEKAATGRWLEGFLEERPDGLMTHGHVFAKTPFRVTQLPVTVPDHLVSRASASIEVFTSQ